MQDIRKYKGYIIRRSGTFGPPWLIQTYHKTGMPYSEEHCPHYPSIQAAKDAINRGELEVTNG